MQTLPLPTMKSEILIACFSILVVPSFILSIYAITQLPSADNAPFTAGNLTGNWECSGTYALINEVGIANNYSHPETLVTGVYNLNITIEHVGVEVFFESWKSGKQGHLCKAKTAKDFICYEYYDITTGMLSVTEFITLNDDGTYSAFLIATGDTLSGYGVPRMYNRHCSRASS